MQEGYYPMQMEAPPEEQHPSAAPVMGWGVCPHLEWRKGALESTLAMYTEPVRVDYRYELPPEFQRHAFTDKIPTDMAKVATASLGHTQAYDRPFHPFTTEQIRHAFNLGDEPLPPRSPLRGSTEIPMPQTRNFSSTIVPEPPPKPEVVAPPPHTQPAPAAAPPVAPPAGKKKRPSSGPPGAHPPSKQSKQAAQAAAVYAPPVPVTWQPTVPQVYVPPPPPAMPTVLLDESLPLPDTFGLTLGQRRVIDLTADEVDLITGEMVRKMKNKKCKNWKKKGPNPMDVDIQRDNCETLGAPNYFDVIKEPMNLVMMARKVKEREYATMYDFRRDVELMVQNALTYNKPSSPEPGESDKKAVSPSPVYVFAGEVKTLFETLWAAFLKDYEVLDQPPTQHQV